MRVSVLSSGCLLPLKCCFAFQLPSSFLINGGTGFFNAKLKMSIFKSLVLCDSCYVGVNLACVYRINVSMCPQWYIRMFVFKLSNFQPLTKISIKQLTSKPIIVYFKNANVLYFPDYSVSRLFIYTQIGHNFRSLWYV